MKDPRDMTADEAATMIAFRTLSDGLAHMALALDRAGRDAIGMLTQIDRDAVARMQRVLAADGREISSTEAEALKRFAAATAEAKKFVHDHGRASGIRPDA